MAWPQTSRECPRAFVIISDSIAADVFAEIEDTVAVLLGNGCLPAEAWPECETWQQVRWQLCRWYCDHNGLNFDRVAEGIENHRWLQDEEASGDGRR